jgi:hypothetical protein
MTKSKSRANVQHKSGKKWEIKKSKSQKSRSLLVKQRQSGNIRFKVGSFFSGVVGHNPKKSGKFLSAPLIFSFPYAHDSTNILVTIKALFS